jgi:hypothetical protein
LLLNSGGVVGKLNNNDQSLSMIVALTKWETTANPAVAIEPIEHQAIASG